MFNPGLSSLNAGNKSTITTKHLFSQEDGSVHRCLEQEHEDNPQHTCMESVIMVHTCKPSAEDIETNGSWRFDPDSTNRVEGRETDQ